MQAATINRHVNPLTKTHKYYSIEARGPMLDRVFDIRYRSYYSGNYIDAKDSMRFMDEYDPMPGSKSFLTYAAGKLIGSIRSCVYKPNVFVRIPIFDVFEREISESVGKEHTLVEANKFVVAPEYQKKGGLRARFSIYRNIADTVIKENASALVAGVREEHIKFYKALHFKPVTDARSYPHLNFKTVLMACRDVNSFCDLIYSKTEQADPSYTSNMSKASPDDTLFSHSNY